MDKEKEMPEEVLGSRSEEEMSSSAAETSSSKEKYYKEKYNLGFDLNSDLVAYIEDYEQKGAIHAAIESYNREKEQAKEEDKEAVRDQIIPGIEGEFTKEEVEYYRASKRKDTIDEKLHEERLDRERERQERDRKSGRSKKEREAMMAERYGVSEPKVNHHLEWIHSEQLGDRPVEWPDTQEAAQKHIKDILGRIEIAQASVTTQMQVDYQNATQVLEVLEVREEDYKRDAITGELTDVRLTPQEIKDQQEWAAKMRLEMKARLELHQAFFKYENGSSTDDAKKAALGLDADWLNVIFGFEEEVVETGEKYNLFTEALQYYEDNGHKFARHNSRELRGVFGKEVQAYLNDYVDKIRLGLNEKNNEEHFIPKDEKDFTSEEREKYNKYIRERLEQQIEKQYMIKDRIIAEYGVKREKDLTEEQKRDYEKKYKEQVEKKVEEVVKKRKDGQAIGKSDLETIKELYLENRLDEKEFAWAQNMAERLFRTTCRAIRYDYLVINKDSKDPQKPETMVNIYYDGPERPEWAGGRDGCDYPESKIMDFRKNLRSGSEFELMRPIIELFDGCDLYADDFWVTVSKKQIINPGKNPLRTYRVASEDIRKVKVAKKAKDLVEKDGLTEAEAKEAAEKLYFVPKDAKGEKEKIYRQADIYDDRETDDNVGEIIGRIDFRKMGRKLNEKKEVIKGIEFKKMGDVPMSLWASRRLGGPEEGKAALTKDATSFLMNPTFESLSKLISTFDYSKVNAWKVKERLTKNLIKYLQSKAYEATGRKKLTDEQIIAGVNELSGYTNPDAPQFIQFEERTEILAEFLHINTELTEREKARVLLQAREQAEREIREEKPELLPESDEFKEAVKNRAAKKAARLEKVVINSRIEHKINTQFGVAFAAEFALGAVKAGLKQALAELGIK